MVNRNAQSAERSAKASVTSRYEVNTSRLTTLPKLPPSLSLPNQITQEPTMSSQAKARFIIPILIIIVGMGWLLTARGYGPGINWIWALGLGVIGILTFVLASGIDKVSVVVGPFFLFASILSILRQTGYLALEMEVPILVISIGILMLVAQFPGIPKPKWQEELTPPMNEPTVSRKLRSE